MFNFVFTWIEAYTYKFATIKSNTTNLSAVTPLLKFPPTLNKLCCIAPFIVLLYTKASVHRTNAQLTWVY